MRQGLITGILHFLSRRQASVVIFVPIDFDTVEKKVPVWSRAPSARSSSGPLAAESSRRRNRQMRRLLFTVNAIGFGAENRPPTWDRPSRALTAKASIWSRRSRSCSLTNLLSPPSATGLEEVIECVEIAILCISRATFELTI